MMASMPALRLLFSACSRIQNGKQSRSYKTPIDIATAAPTFSFVCIRSAISSFQGSKARAKSMAAEYATTKGISGDIPDTQVDG